MTVAQAQAAYYQAYPNVPYISDAHTWFVWWNDWWQAHGGWPTIDLVAATYPVDAQIMRAFGYISGSGIPKDVLSSGYVTADELQAAKNALTPSGVSASATSAYNAQVAANNQAVSPDQTIFTLGTQKPVSAHPAGQLTSGTAYSHPAVTPTVPTAATTSYGGFTQNQLLMIGGGALALILILKMKAKSAQPVARH